MQVYITNNGTYINKKDFKESELEVIKKELHIVPKSTADYGEPIDQTFDTFMETSDKLYIPKFYALKKFDAKKIKDNVKLLNPSNIKFKGQLRELQENVVKISLDKLSKNGGGIISLPTGFGKTVIAINIATKLKVKTLIIVGKTFLSNQWVERIKQYTNCTDIGIIQGSKIETSQPFVIGMLQSISMKDYDTDIFNNFDLVIYDECHHLSARVFSQALLKINTKYTIGLSATVARSDRTEKVFLNFLGDILYQEVVELKHKVKIEIHNYSITRSRYFRDVIGKNGKAIQPIIVTNLTLIEQRDNYIFDKIYDLKMNEPSRKILILSDRIDHLKKMHEKFQDTFEGDTGFYIGGMKEKDLKISESKDLIFASYSMVSEGLDIQALDTLILMTPKAKMVQTIGRILRKKPEEYENQPLIIDIVDQIPTLIYLGMARKKVYTTRNYEITYHNVKDNTIEKTWNHDYTKDVKPTTKTEIAFIDTDDEKETTETKPKETKPKETKSKKNIINEIDDGFIDD
jgi:superfamily II DNA or RNA helicase